MTVWWLSFKWTSLTKLEKTPRSQGSFSFVAWHVFVFTCFKWQLICLLANIIIQSSYSHASNHRTRGRARDRKRRRRDRETDGCLISCTTSTRLQIFVKTNLGRTISSETHSLTSSLSLLSFLLLSSLYLVSSRASIPDNHLNKMMRIKVRN